MPKSAPTPTRCNLRYGGRRKKFHQVRINRTHQEHIARSCLAQGSLPSRPCWLLLWINDCDKRPCALRVQIGGKLVALEIVTAFHTTSQTWKASMPVESATESNRRALK